MRLVRTPLGKCLAYCKACWLIKVLRGHPLLCWPKGGEFLIRIGMIGLGYWGPNLARNFRELEDTEVVWCSDLSQDRLNKISKRYPGVKCSTNYEEVLKDQEVDAV